MKSKERRKEDKNIMEKKKERGRKQNIKHD
jgi:hypothetical protein